MDEELLAVVATRKTGNEPFTLDGTPAGATLLDFWRWSGSDLLSNAMRGILAEYIVGLALNCTESGTRLEWDAADLVTPQGVRIEVKSAAYLQTWAQERHSKISFGIRPTVGWDAATNTLSKERKRQADVYVFAVLHHQSKASVDPLNLAQWEFHVLSTERLNATVPLQRTITLSSLMALKPATVGYDGLQSAVSAANESRAED